MRNESLDSSIKFPVVGLPKLKAAQLDQNNEMKLNPFILPKRSELMLIHNERMRIQEQMTREKMKNVFSIHEKGTSNFRNREGVIREIHSIKPIDEQPGFHHNLTAKKNLKRYSQAMAMGSEKLNIFETDPDELEDRLNVIKQENTLAQHSQSVAPKEAQTLDVANMPSKKSAHMAYLQDKIKQKESRKDFVNQSRDLLFLEISIRNKKEETEKLKEFIVTENEKLLEAKNSFKEDRDKFQKYVEQLALEAEKASRKTGKLEEIKSQK
eukprot:CAMPEP_0196997396 /NCGR_PEP_ID=MMETSP1380-20130617/3020_1 /TAXON_ID=5936 /ORGANISM="Euplotes crassus, Strain CT5" /LENGTH=267 /DNA_ID=CAMNT_0042413615 /DNA_START=148 /DNA_END=951 /DNA_ORIENTATION=-